MTDTQERIRKEISGMDDLDLYDYFISRAISSENKNIRNEKNKIDGCVSGLWVEVGIKDNRVSVTSDSDSLIIKGVSLCICDIFSGMTIDEVKETEITFLSGTDLSGELDDKRRTGLAKIKDRILSV